MRTLHRRTPLSREDRDARAAQLRADLEAKVAELLDSERWLQFLAFAAKFHSYSFSNVLLIMAQHPTATQVAGFRRWQQLGRQVRKGEKAIRIYAYSRRKTDETDPDGRPVFAAWYPIVSVFAHDQTDPIEGFVAPPHPAVRLTGDDPNGIAEAVQAALTVRGWTVRHEPLTGHTNGYTTIDGTKHVVIGAGLSPAQQAKTAIHEFAHVVLHVPAGGDHAEDLRRHRGLIEVEAESVAYVVAGLLGLDTGDYSAGYVAEWAKGDLRIVRDAAERVLHAAKTIADALDATLSTPVAIQGITA